MRVPACRAAGDLRGFMYHAQVAVLHLDNLRPSAEITDIDRGIILQYRLARPVNHFVKSIHELIAVASRSNRHPVFLVTPSFHPYQVFKDDKGFAL